MANQDEGAPPVAGLMLVGVVLLIVGAIVGLRINWSAASAAASGAYQVPDRGHTAITLNPTGSVALTPSAGGGADDSQPRIRVFEGTVKFYFAPGKADLADGADEALSDIVKGVAAGEKAVITPFYGVVDERSDAELLAGERALAVHDALAALGIGEDKMALRTPELATGGEGQRVEVALQEP